jgi:peptidoglycan/LPS O-acetylase OafA/YrhL
LVIGFSGPTLADRLIASANRPAGFDYLRLLLASSVIATHSLALTLTDFHRSRPLAALILPMFFALSGFLVCGSLVRCRTLGTFLALRVLRLFPALVVETVLSALVIGPVFTSLPLNSYFEDPSFLGYFTSLVGVVKYKLPGVFTANPFPAYVNGQLWTLPYELYCYILLAVAVLLGLVRRDARFAAVVIVLVLFAFVRGLFKIAPTGAVGVSGPVLVLCFLVGVAAYLFRDKIVWSGRLAAASLVAALLCLSSPLAETLVALPATYLTIYLGLLDPRRVGLVAKGDYSYGLFLYGFPIQQATLAALGEPGRHWSVNLAIAFPIAFAVAAFSWWCVERPFLLFKPLIYRAEAWSVSRLAWLERSVTP